MREGPDPAPEPSGSGLGDDPGSPGPDPALVARVNAAFRALHTAVEGFVAAASERYGINRTDQRCLEILDRGGPITAGQLADAAGLSAAAITKVVDRLLAAGYVQRLRADDDRRQVIIATTPAEQRLAGEIFGPLVADGQRLLHTLSDDDLRMLLDVLTRAAALNDAHTVRLRRQTSPGG